MQVANFVAVGVLELPTVAFLTAADPIFEYYPLKGIVSPDGEGIVSGIVSVE